MCRATWHGFGFIYSYFNHENHSLFNVDVFSGGIYDLAKFPYFIVRAMVFMIITHDIFKSYVFFESLFVSDPCVCLAIIIFLVTYQPFNIFILAFIPYPLISCPHLYKLITNYTHNLSACWHVRLLVV